MLISRFSIARKPRTAGDLLVSTRVGLGVGIVMEAEFVLSDRSEAEGLVLSEGVMVALSLGVVVEAEFELSDGLEAEGSILSEGVMLALSLGVVVEAEFEFVLSEGLALSNGVMVALPLASRVRWTLAEASRSTKTAAFARSKKAETLSSSLEGVSHLSYFA
jgi:hypothetical protein